MITAIRPLTATDIPAASELVLRVFQEFEAPDYPSEGIETFHRLIAPEALALRLRSGEIRAWGAFHDNIPVGILTARDTFHISLLFVDKRHHRQGIARALFCRLLDECRRTPGTRRITVNSAPYPLPFYVRLGFSPTDTEQNADGIRYTPMEYPL